jgi:hypothetical protein
MVFGITAAWRRSEHVLSCSRAVRPKALELAAKLAQVRGLSKKDDRTYMLDSSHVPELATFPNKQISLKLGLTKVPVRDSLVINAKQKLLCYRSPA